MNALPDALRPWREWLSWFDPDLAAQLGPLLQRLHPLLGPFRGQSHGGEPELEGLDDLRSRGAYQHLLATEWLLAEEMPDEFLRRAASGEHMFLAPRPRARRADRSIIALFDAGPLQLGAPRLAQLAIWILLARRAVQAQGEFRWGSLQSPGKLLEARTADDLKALLRARSFVMPDATSHGEWRSTLDEQKVGGERWLIGPSLVQSELQTLPAFTHRVCVQSGLHGAALDVSLSERGTERTISLPLPEPASSTALLHGSFVRAVSGQQHTSAPNAIAMRRPPVIGFEGTRVALVLRDEPGALVFVIPRSLQDQPSKPRFQRWSAGYGALAISFIGKRLGVLMSDENELRFWGTPMTMRPCPTREEFHAPSSVATWLQLAWLKHGADHSICVVDQSQRLLRWDFGGSGHAPSERLLLVAENVLSMAQINRGLIVFAYHENGSVYFGKGGPTVGTQKPQHLCEAPSDALVFFGRGSSVAVRTTKQPTETWHFGSWHGQRLVWQAQLQAGARVIGLMRESNGRTALVTLDRNMLRAHFSDGANELLYEAPDPIASCTMCPYTSIVAMMTDRRQLIVFAAATRELRLIVQTARQSHASD